MTTKKPNAELFRLLRFAIRYPGWHNFGSDARPHLKRGEALSLFEIDYALNRFRLPRGSMEWGRRLPQDDSHDGHRVTRKGELNGYAAYCLDCSEGFDDVPRQDICTSCKRPYGDHYDEQCPDKDTDYSPPPVHSGEDPRIIEGLLAPSEPVGNPGSCNKRIACNKRIVSKPLPTGFLRCELAWGHDGECQ